MTDKNQDERTIYQRLNAVSDAIPVVKKDKTIGSGGFAYSVTTMDYLLSVVGPLLVENGIHMSSRVLKSKTKPVELKGKNGIRTEFMTEQKVETTFACSDKTNVVVTTFGHGLDNGDKSAGKAFTYARKSALQSVLYISTHENEEDRREGDLKKDEQKRKDDVINQAKNLSKSLDQQSAASLSNTKANRSLIGSLFKIDAEEAKTLSQKWVVTWIGELMKSDDATIFDIINREAGKWMCGLMSKFPEQQKMYDDHIAPRVSQQQAA